MLRLSDLSQVPPDLGPMVVTLGNFDGVHRGHAAVLERVVAEAAARNAKSCAITFEPHPLEVLHPERAPERITDLQERVRLIEKTGIDVLLVLPFDRELAAQTPEEFVRGCFVEGLNACAVIVGKDTRFGAKNSGDITTLRELGEQFGFDVLTLDDVGPGVRWSSTQVRALLGDGRVDEAADALARGHRVEGVVVRGLQRGRELGFPTANLSQDAGGMVPADGVYAGWLVRTDDDGVETPLPAAISVGTNPTFENVQRTVEAYVLDRDDLDLYGEHVAIEFVRRLRGNTRFESVDDLVVQMHRDVDQARKLLLGDG